MQNCHFGDFEDALRAVESGAVECRIVPLENSLEGAVAVVMDLLLHLKVANNRRGEPSIRLCLVGRGESEIRVILSILSLWPSAGNTSETIIPKAESGPRDPPATPPGWPRSSRRWQPSLVPARPRSTGFRFLPGTSRTQGERDPVCRCRKRDAAATGRGQDLACHLP